MGDTENSLPPSKKRAAGREISRDNPGLDDDDEGTSEQEMGSFKKASEEVLASRKIVKVRRNPTSSIESAPSSNPFAGIRLVPPPASAATTAVVTDETKSSENQEQNEGKVDVSKEINKESEEKDQQSESKDDEPKDESTAENDKNNNIEETNKPQSTDDKGADNENSESKPKKGAKPDNADKEAGKDSEVPEAVGDAKKDGGSGSVEKGGEGASFSSFQQLSSNQNAFTGLAGTGFSASTFSFGSLTKEGSSPNSGLQNNKPSLSFGLSNNGSSSLFGSSGASTITKTEGSGFPSMPEVPVETGEENEKPAFTTDSVLFEYIDGSWKERGKGELKVNVPSTRTGKARLVMRTKGNYRLILNASLFPDMKLTNMDKRGITFACVNSTGEGKDGLSTFALKFKDGSIVEDFRSCVMEHKGKLPAAVALKTPENSPKASDDQ